MSAITNFGTELIIRIIGMFKLVSKFANPAEETISLCEVSRTLLHQVDIVTKARYIFVQPFNELRAREAVRIFPNKWETDGSERQLGRSACEQARYSRWW